MREFAITITQPYLQASEPSGKFVITAYRTGTKLSAVLFTIEENGTVIFAQNINPDLGLKTITGGIAMTSLYSKDHFFSQYNLLQGESK